MAENKKPHKRLYPSYLIVGLLLLPAAVVIWHASRSLMQFCNQYVENDASQVLRSVSLEIALAVLIIACVAGMIGYFIAHRRARPKRVRESEAGRVAEGDEDSRMTLPDSDETGERAKAMDDMAVQLDDRIKVINRQRYELETILSSMGESVVVVNKEGHVIRFNLAAGKLLGVDQEVVRGRSIEEAIGSEDLHKFVKRTLASDAAVEDDIVLKNDGERFLRATGTLLRGTDGKTIGALVVLHDVTNLKELEDMRREFIANISHEIKTPVTSIKGFVEALKEGSVSDKTSMKEFLDIIAKHTDRLDSIVEDLLNLTQLEDREGLGEIPLEKGRIKDVIDSAVLLHKSKIHEKKIKIEIFCAESITAKFNHALLEKAVSNLVDNAIKYSDPGSLVEIRGLRRNGGVVIKVADSGCGIPEEHLPRIFERFYRVDKGRSRDLGGSGLGLAIVKHIAQAHQGNVEAESIPGKGSTFSILLPE